jgi:hypothetical protein
MNTIKVGLLALPFALVLSGCAEQRLRQQVDADARVAAVLDHAGPPVSMFNLDSHHASWEALGNEHLLVRSTSGETWLLRTEVCPGLPNQRYVALTYSRDSFIYTGKDRLASLGPGGSCALLEARPVAGVDVHGAPGRLLMFLRPKQEDLAGSF